MPGAAAPPRLAAAISASPATTVRRSPQRPTMLPIAIPAATPIRLKMARTQPAVARPMPRSARSAGNAIAALPT